METPLRRSKRRRIRNSKYVDSDFIGTTTVARSAATPRHNLEDVSSSSDEGASPTLKTPLPLALKKGLQQDKNIVVIDDEETPVVTSSSNSSSDVDDDTKVVAMSEKSGVKTFNTVRMVTPEDDGDDDVKNKDKDSKKRKANTPTARRSLFQNQTTPASAAAASPDSAVEVHAAVEEEVEVEELPKAKKRLIFGKYMVNSSNIVQFSEGVKDIYKVVRRRTGMIGGNGSQGPIYGELTMGSMQKFINLLKEYTQFDSTSTFLDVGSGVGKPNLHVTQDPGVAFSCGIEMEYDRWRLSMICLQGILQDYQKEEQQQQKDSSSRQQPSDEQEPAQIIESPEQEQLNSISANRHKCIFIHGNIMAAKTFDPFSHVYMFSIGFPPALWRALAVIWNNTIRQQDTQTKYLICFHPPRDIIQKYQFHVTLLTQTNQSLSMHGSKEGHKGYIYVAAPQTSSTRNTRKNPLLPESSLPKSLPHTNVKCDEVFLDAYQTVTSQNNNLQLLCEKVETELHEHMESGRGTRSATKKRGLVLSKT